MWLIKHLVQISMSILDKLIFAKNFIRPRLPGTTHMYIRKFLELAVLIQSADTYLDRCEKFRSAV
jgi:hypothetical protein